MDTLLLTFIEATDEDQADRCLTRLIDEHAAPIVREILASSLRVYVDLTGGATSNQDVGDLFNDIVVNLVSRLRYIKLDPEQESIADFRGYVAGAAYNTCNLYLRQKFPRRSRLKNRLRYLLSHDVDFALWITEEFGLLCGFASWRDKKERAPGKTLETITQDPSQWTERAGLTTVGLERDKLTNLLKVIFRWCGSPIRLDARSAFLGLVLLLFAIPVAAQQEANADREAAIVSVSKINYHVRLVRDTIRDSFIDARNCIRAIGRVASNQAAVSEKNNYDACVIGTGPGGAVAAATLALRGKKVVLVERGPFVPPEKVTFSNPRHVEQVWSCRNPEWLSHRLVPGQCFGW